MLQVQSIGNQLGISNPLPTLHFTQHEYETLINLIDEEESLSQSLMFEGYLKRKLTLKPTDDMYDNYRFKVIALIRNLGLSDDQMTGLPLHFNQAEHLGLEELVKGQDQSKALQLMRGFISHKVQINPDDTCLSADTTDTTSSPASSDPIQQHDFTIKVWDQNNVTTSTSSSKSENKVESEYFSLFSKIKKIW